MKRREQMRGRHLAAVQCGAVHCWGFFRAVARAALPGQDEPVRQPVTQSVSQAGDDEPECSAEGGHGSCGGPD